MSSAHPVAPDIFELGDLVAAAATAEERRRIERALDPRLTGAAPLSVPCRSAALNTQQNYAQLD